MSSSNIPQTPIWFVNIALFRTQDQQLDDLSATVNRLGAVSLSIGQELDSHGNLLEELDEDMDGVRARLGALQVPEMNPSSLWFQSKHGMCASHVDLEMKYCRKRALRPWPQICCELLEVAGMFSWCLCLNISSARRDTISVYGILL